MNIVLVVLVLLLLVGGAVGLILGRKNINVWTLVGAWLTLLTAVGFIYLAGRVAERERVWREKIRQTQAELKTTIFGPLAGKTLTFAKRDEDATDAQQMARQELLEDIEAVGGVITDKISRGVDYYVVADASAGIPENVTKYQLEVLDQAALEKSLSQSLKALDETIAIKRREQIALETWRNRYWRTSFFKPPEVEIAVDKPGLYEINRSAVVELPLAGGGESAPINQGAELAIFNLNADDEEGFLGLFSVTKVTAADARVLEVTIDPLTMPDEYDKRAWDRWSLIMRSSDKAEVVVFEDLPGAGQQSPDALTRLRGIQLESPGGDLVTAQGIEGLRREILLEMNTIASNEEHIRLALEATTREAERKKLTASALDKDRAAWREDVEFAGQALEKLTIRTKQTQEQLAQTRREIAAKRAELVETTSLFLSEMGRRPPRPAPGETSRP